MSDRLDARINAFVLELLDQPVEPPEFPTAPAIELSREMRRPLRPGWLVAAAVFAAVLIIGIVAALLTGSKDEVPVVDTTPEGVVETLTSAINDGDLEASLALFADEAQCVAPGLPTCEDLFGFFVAADAFVVLNDCVVNVEPYLVCDGYMHTPIHDVLGISIDALAAQPNFPPGLIVEDGKIIQFNFMTPFTGDPEMDDMLWTGLAAIEPGYVNEDGVPRLSAAIVPAVLEAAAQAGEQSDS